MTTTVTLTGLPRLTVDLRSEVVDEFQTMAANGELGIESKGYMKKILTKALGEEKAAQIIASLAAPEFAGLESLKWMDARALAHLVAVEHPQTAAVILAHLEPELASQALSLLPENMRLDVAHRLATIEEIPQDVLKDLSEVLEAELKIGLKSHAQQLGGVKFLADILNGMDKGLGNALTAGLSERSESLAESVKQLMFVFDDLVGVDDRGLQELLKEVAKEELTLALRAAGEPVKAALFKNMSSRAVELLKDDMEAGGPVKLAEVERAQRNILQVARKLEEEGRLVLGARSGEEMV